MLGDTEGKAMSRSKTRYTTNDTYNRPRVATVNATPRVRPVVLPSVSTFNYPLILLEDRRTFHPDGQFRLPAARYRSDTQLVPKGRSNGSRGKSRSVRSVLYSAPPAAVGFARPDRVAICVRRKTRRQVIFASGVGGTKVRRGKRTYKSGFHCH